MCLRCQLAVDAVVAASGDDDDDVGDDDDDDDNKSTCFSVSITLTWIIAMYDVNSFSCLSYYSLFLVCFNYGQFYCFYISSS